MRSVIAFFLAVTLLFCATGCAKQDIPEDISEPEVSASESETGEATDTAELESYNQWLSSLFCGIIKLEERAGAYGDEQLGGGAYMPMRFTHERIEAYKQYNSVAKVGAPYYNCTTGVRMDFYTDANEISFKYVVQDSFFDRSADHPDDCFALFENGELKQTYLVQYGTNTELIYRRESAEESRITIVFPNWHGVTLSQISLGEARPYEEYDRKFLFLGDSIGQGLFADNPSESWTNLVATYFNADYINLAVGGEVFRQGALDPLEDFEPTHIIVALGENDYYSGLTEDEMARNCYLYLTELKNLYPGIPITVVSSFNLDKPQSWTERMLSTAQLLGCNTIDGTGFGGEDAENWNIDKVHPASPGFKNIADSMIPELENLL